MSEATARLEGQFEALRILVNLIAQDKQMTKAIANHDENHINDILKLHSLRYGAWRIDLADQTGQIIGSSDPQNVGTVISTQLSGPAMNARLGYRVHLGDGPRLVQFSRGVMNAQHRNIGTVAVSADIASLEFEWPVTPEPVLFYDKTGISASSNRPELLFLTIPGTPDHPIQPAGTVAGAKLWTYQQADDTKSEVLIQKRRIDPLQMDALILLSTDTARATARLRLWLTITLFAVFFLAAAIAVQQRRRLALETQHSATLETRVQDRTRELRETQDQLIESSKLAALGRLSAGISHELNQPLSAIMNFSENGRRFLGIGKAAKAEENFELISEQVRRITRIISGLRAFARQEVAPTETVDLRAITINALDMAAQDMAAAEVALDTRLPPDPVPVKAGRVRMEQVILNLVSNAIDSMQSVETRCLNVILRTSGENACLTVSDTGPGIADLDRVFEPFYSTKELGASKGLGMGLALSYGLIGRFGGSLTCANTETGARFTITLPLSSEAE